MSLAANKAWYGYAGRVLTVDLTSGSFTFSPLEEDLVERFIGGRGLNVAWLYSKMKKGLDPLSPENPLVFGVGPFAGTMFPGGSRFNVSAKSPHTGILGDSNAGGFFGAELKFAGLDQLRIFGKAPQLSYLFIHNDRVEIRPALHLAGLDVWETDSAIRAEVRDPRAQIACAGPAAEHGVTFAGIFTNLVRPAARTGMGTVMASKNLKAIVVRGTRPVRVADPKAFASLLAELDKDIRGHREYGARALMGTTRLVHALNEAGCLATRHFKTGRFHAAEDVSGERLAEVHKKKSKACYGCTIPCSRFYEIASGPYAGLKSEGPEFEGLAGFSSRVGVADLGAALKGVDICNRLGMDVITASEVISFAMECYESGIISREEADGLDLTWGNEQTVFTLLEKIGRREGFGDVLADGVKKAAERIGRGSEKLAMHVKGLEVFQADPRGLKAYALGYALASRGGDHLRSEPSFEFSEDPEEGLRRFGARESAFRLEYKGKGRVVKYYEELSALADILDACKNTIVNMEVLPFDRAADFLRAATGRDAGEAYVQRVCERIVNLERAFIVREGIRRKDDTLPERFLKEPLPAGSGPSAGSVVELEPMLDEYYEARGWDVATGVPTREKLEVLGLDDVVRDLEEWGVSVPRRDVASLQILHVDKPGNAW